MSGTLPESRTTLITEIFHGYLNNVDQTPDDVTNISVDAYNVSLSERHLLHLSQCYPHLGSGISTIYDLTAECGIPLSTGWTAHSRNHTPISTSTKYFWETDPEFNVIPRCRYGKRRISMWGSQTSEELIQISRVNTSLDLHQPYILLSDFRIGGLLLTVYLFFQIRTPGTSKTGFLKASSLSDYLCLAS